MWRHTRRWQRVQRWRRGPLTWQGDMANQIGGGAQEEESAFLFFLLLQGRPGRLLQSQRARSGGDEGFGKDHKRSEERQQGSGSVSALGLAWIAGGEGRISAGGAENAARLGGPFQGCSVLCGGMNPGREASRRSEVRRRAAGRQPAARKNSDEAREMKKEAAVFCTVQKIAAGLSKVAAAFARSSGLRKDGEGFREGVAATSGGRRGAEPTGGARFAAGRPAALWGGRRVEDDGCRRWSKGRRRRPVSGLMLTGLRRRRA